MVFTRTGEEFSTRLSINNCTIDKNPLHKILGVWISEDLSWEKNTKEICRKSYSRMSMLTKLKYIGTSIEYFLEIYVLFIRSISEYCSVAYHSSLTVSQSTDLERIQKTCLKIILGDNYINYPAALEMTGLDSLFDRREARCLKFALKSLKHPIQSKKFPPNRNLSNENPEVRNREHFHVNFARTQQYKKSAIPYCQRLLNDYFNEKK